MIGVAAVSQDGYMARGPTDDLSWTGSFDKQLFRLLTHTHPLVLVGANTAQTMPALRGRTTQVLSRSTRPLSAFAAFELQRATMAGGPVLLDYALQNRLLARLFVMHIPTYLREGLRLPDVPSDYPRVDSVPMLSGSHRHVVVNIYERKD